MIKCLPNVRIILLILGCMIASTLSWGQSTDAVHEGIIRIKVKPELVANSELSGAKIQGIAMTGVASLDRLCRLYAASNIERVFPYSTTNEERHRKHGLHLWYELKFDSKEDAQKVASAYAGLSEISQAEPLYKTKLITGEFRAMDNTTTTSDALPFNDPYLSRQWHYHNTGDFEGTPGSDINLFEAWKITAGTPNVVVSVHDEGVDYTHEDLAANMWKNMAEFNGVANVDDDHNGFVDDIYGYNFAAHTGKIDRMEHGTHVSGTIAAVNNNGKGVSGVAGGTGIGDGARIMSCEILGGTVSNIPASYIYAADNGSLISQNSWGYTTPGNYEQATLDAIDYFIAEAGNFAGSPMKGGVVIFAAGNDNANEQNYPGYYQNVVAVSSLGPTSTRAWYSNFGEWIDIASYGGDDTKHAQNQVLSTIPNNGYAYMQGTSMATPHVSGIAALILSKFGSSTFTNQQLLTHLLTGVRNVDSFNPDFAGLLGAGISDAAKALAANSGIAPVKITDLTLTGISQDFATLQWTVPVDQDDQQPLQFKVYYNTDSITAANLSSSTQVTLQNNQMAGDVRQYEVDGLQSTTHYYFMVVSVDRWGNASPFSNVVNGTTNDGPTITLDKTEVDLSLDIAQATTATDSFKILNTGSGVLKWTAQFRHKNLYLPFNKAKLHYPIPGAQPSSLNMTLGKQRVAARTTGVPIDGDTFTPSQKTYWNPEGPTYVIGEENLSLTNSEATKFTVTEEAGFNLTQVQAFLASDDKRGPMIMEIYLGSSLNTATLTYAQEVTSYQTDGYWHDVYLDENIFLEKGTDFWIVFHVPAGNKYPLGMGLEAEADFSNNCFMSNDLGKTWIPLAKAIDDDRWVFTVLALSDQPTLGNYITLNPTSSTVLSGGTEEVSVVVDGTTLRNGSYSADVVINTNDKENALVRLPVNLEITNHQPELQVADISDFGSVFVGTEKMITVAVSNLGYGDFSQVTLTISDPQFTLVDDAPSKIAARMVETISFKYKPAQQGSANATITLTDGNSNSHQFYLNGVGSLPPVISLNPGQVTINNLVLGNDFTTSVNIQNTGQYPLKYAFSKFADSNTLNEFGTGVQKFGYSYNANLTGTGQPAYSFTEISSEPNIISQFDRSEYYGVDIGFDFPFYGKTYSKLFITRLGAVTFADDGSLNGSTGRIGDITSPSGYITASWTYFDPKAGGGIHYQHQPGKMIIEYKNIVMNSPVLGKWPATFQIILYDNGNVDIAYDDLSAWDAFDLSYFLIGMDDPAHQDGYTISDVYNPLAITSHSIIRINNPGVGALKSVSSVNGVIPAGGSQGVDLTFGTTSLHEGSFSELVSILSNDPFNNPTHAKVDFNITSGGVAAMSVDKDTVDFGSVFRTSVVKAAVAIQNTGTKDIQITSMTLPGGKFTLDKTAPFIVKARETQFVTATLKTNAVGTFNGILTIKNNIAQTFTVHIFSKVVPEPIMTINIPGITKQLASGDSTKVSMMVTNSGQSDLEFVTQGTDWLYVPQDTTGTEKTYSWITSSDPGGPTYNWLDIRKTGTYLDSLDSFSNDKFWKGIKLPFIFPFYGKKYDSLYVGANGVVSFTRSDQAYPFGIDDIPLTDPPNNFIAPLWIPGGPLKYIYSDAGVYYQTFSDKVVVTYYKFGNVFSMGDPISFQAILYNTGNIKFQYALGSFDETSILGTVGLENLDGTDGVLIANKENLLRDQMAIIVQPTSKQIVPALSSKQINVVVDARYLYAGSYTGNLVFQNNTPANPKVQIPATLTVIGLPSLSWPDSIAFGQVMPYLEADEYGIVSDKAYYQYFDLINTGKDKAIVNAFAFKQGSPELVVETQVEDPFFGGIYWTNVNDLSDPMVIVPDGRTTLRVTMIPQGPGHVVRDTLALSTNLTVPNFSFPVSATVIMPPVMILDTDHLTVQADTLGQVQTRQFNLDNTAGASTLQYSMSLEYLRAKPDAVSKSVLPNPKTTNSSARMASQSAMLLASPSVPMTGMQARTAAVHTASISQYNRILQYDTLSKATAMLGFNGSSEFWCASAFNAPNDGFTLSHVITWYAPGEFLSSDIVVQILGGSDDITKTQVLYSQDFNYTVNAADTQGQFVEIALDKSQSFYPGEKFFVVVKYPFGLTYPQGAATLKQNLANTFFYGSGDGTWGDLTTGGFPSYGWMIKAAEKTATTVGWASINGNMTGSADAGFTQPVNVVFNSRLTQDADNYAYVNITSNDPYHKTAKVLLLLHRNQAPVFENGDRVNLTVAENDTLQYTVDATDPESDPFTYSLASPYNKVKLSQAGGHTVLTFVTNYDMEGDYEFVINATDTFSNVSIQTLAVTVTHVNRAPVLIKPIPTKNYYKGAEAERINLLDFFKDPDGDPLNFVTISLNDSIALIFASGPQIMISPEGAGDTRITTKVTDGDGASITYSFDAHVAAIAGLDTKGATFHVFAYPNPTADKVYLHITGEINPFYTIRVMNVLGMKMLEITNSNGSRGDTEIDLSKMSTGVYFVEVTDASGSSVRRVIKE